jgi:gliding motility-associated-like protein
LLNLLSAQSPALIKAGQVLSSRSDLLPKEYLDSLNIDNKIDIDIDIKTYLKLPKFMQTKLKGYRVGVEFNDKQLEIDPYFLGESQVKYNIKITDRYGCLITDTLNVYIFKNAEIYLPNAFTPNKDQLNDRFRPLLVGIKKLLYFKIYNRWGEEIFNTSDASKGWDGTYKGQLQPIETYTWIASGIDLDGRTINKSGNFLLIK